MTRNPPSSRGDIAGNALRQRALDRARDDVAAAREHLGPAFASLCSAIDGIIDAVAGSAAKPAPLCTRRQAAALLNCSARTFDRYVADGLLPAVLLPSATGSEPMRRWTQETLNAFIGNSMRAHG
jgi:hypothetical protein